MGSSLHLDKSNLWTLQFFFDDIKALASDFDVVFYLEVRLVNGLVDALAKLGVTRISPLEVYLWLYCVVW